MSLRANNKIIINKIINYLKHFILMTFTRKFRINFTSKMSHLILLIDFNLTAGDLCW